MTNHDQQDSSSQQQQQQQSQSHNAADDNDEPMVAHHFVAPDFKRRQMIFDSFAKLRQPQSKLRDHSNAKGTLLYAWGAGYHGQLGLSSYRKKCKVVPAYIEFKEPVIQVACGGFHTALLTDSGKVFTWGDGRSGQLGNLARKHNMHATPHLVDRLSQYDIRVTQIACGQYHTACVTDRGDLYSWGSGKHAQLGHGSRLDERYPRRVAVDASIGQFSCVSCGDRHTAAVTRKNAIVTFGSGCHGQLGHGNGWDFTKPKIVEVLADIPCVQVSAGSTVTCAITEDGELYLWGFGERIHPPELTNIVDAPRLVKLKEKVKQVACGQSHILILTVQGDVLAMGNGHMAQLGHGTTTDVRNPRLVLKGKSIQEIAAGRYHSMAVTEAGVLYTWGCGESGQLGLGSLESEVFPRIVTAILPNVVGQIAAGEHHTFCLSSIEHASVSADVQNWLEIEEEELKLKRTMMKDLPSGLKTKHVLQVEQERQRIIAEIAENAQKSKVEETRVLNEQLRSIVEPQKLLQATKSKEKRRQIANELDEMNAKAENANDTNSANLPRFRQPRGSFRNSHHARNDSDSATSRNDVEASIPSVSPKNTGRNSRYGGGGSRLHRHKASHTMSHSTSALRTLKYGKRGNGGSSGANDDSSPPNSMRRKAHGTRSEAVLRTLDEGAESVYKFQPLAPRMSFMERTANTLQRVKQSVIEAPLRPPSISEETLFQFKQTYNSLKAEVRAKSKQLDSLRNAYIYMRPTDEDISRSTEHQMRIKELNMKLVTLSTRQMEADENKKNYELYIIRMKEEDVQLSKQIDHLRHLVTEYDRLLAKMTKMNERLISQKNELDEETAVFERDITDFRQFARSQVAQYHQVVDGTLADDRVAQKNALVRTNYLERKRQQRVERLQREFESAESESSEIKADLEMWMERVFDYEERFHKISVATGVSAPDDIINKFFLNDDVSSDLKKQRFEREQSLSTLKTKLTTAEQQLQDKKSGNNHSKWRDVDGTNEELQAVEIQGTRVKVDYETLVQQLALVQEGAVELTARIDNVLGPDRRRKPSDNVSNVEESCAAWLKHIARRLNALNDEVTRKNNRQNKTRLKERHNRKA